VRIRILSLVLLALVLVLLVPGVLGDYNAADSKVEAKAYVSSPYVEVITSTDPAFSAPANNSISKCVLWLDPGESASFTLTLADGNPIYGTVFYHQDGITSNLEVSIGDQSRIMSETNILPVPKKFLVCYAYDGNAGVTGVIVQDFQRSYFSILGSDLYAFFRVDGIELNLIQSAYFSSPMGDQPITVEFYYGETQGISDQAKESLEDQLWQLIASFVELISWVVSLTLQLAFWFKFIFFDNLLITIGLYFGLTMAVSFGRARDVFDGIQNFIKFQRTFWDFIATFIRTILGVFEAIKNVLLPW
jgi:hypothetical protein